jgi:hypothetical protein
MSVLRNNVAVLRRMPSRGDYQQARRLSQGVGVPNPLCPPRHPFAPRQDARPMVVGG